MARELFSSSSQNDRDVICVLCPIRITRLGGGIEFHFSSAQVRVGPRNSALDSSWRRELGLLDGDGILDGGEALEVTHRNE